MLPSVPNTRIPVSHASTLPYSLWIKSTYFNMHKRPHWYSACPLSCLIFHHHTRWPAGQAPVLWVISVNAVTKVGRLLTPHLSLLMSHPLHWHTASPPLRHCPCQVLPHSQGMHLVLLLMPTLSASLSDFTTPYCNHLLCLHCPPRSQHPLHRGPVFLHSPLSSKPRPEPGSVSHN